MRSVLLFAVLATSLAACSSDIEPGPGDEMTPDGGQGSASPDAPANKTATISGPEVLPHVRAFADAVCTAKGACDMLTYEGHDPTAAQAIDILISDEYGELPSDNNALGDAVAQYALDHYTQYGMMYVIFRQRIHFSTGDWRAMEDRGSITQNHFDHVHVSFNASL